MRVEISYKFIMGFLIVIASVVVVNLTVPYLPILPWLQQPLTIGFALLVGLVIGSLFSKGFTRNIRKLTEAGDRLSRGDLSRDIQVKNRLSDETDDIAASMNQVQASLRELVGEIKSFASRVAEASLSLSVTAQQMTASSHEVAGTVDSISKGAETQAEMVEESNRFFKEMATAINQIAESAQKVAEAAEATFATAQRGVELAQGSTETIRQVLAGMESSGNQMVSFVSRVQQIGQIVEVINGVAHKTNLLALNATIEAARAGEYGRGFTVVAEEIRKLADSTTESSGEITNLVEGIQAEGEHVQGTMAQISREMEAGREAVDRTNHAFAEISRNAEDTRGKAHNISELTQRQIAGAEHISRAIEEIDKIVSDNAAATEQVSAATQQQCASMEEMNLSAKEMSVMSEELLAVVKRFKLMRTPEV
ncbi:MAG TPA: methyl-accepting chemotaxis protein [Desulfuromonadales bacterium]|nr:methyl-accepting chemotaxis protein [Desulfuromonadales bacterium]